METVIGFVIGYLVGTRQGRDGLSKACASLEAIRNSAELRQVLAGGVTVAGSAVRQVLKGNAGTMLGNTVEGLVRKVTEAAA